jgi:hypothetical protein
MAGTRGSITQNIYPVGGTVTEYHLTNTVLHKEGAGNPCNVGSTDCSSLGHPWYTCGAASTRNMTESMTGNDKGEAQFVTWEDITPGVGLPGMSHVASTLNNHYSNWGSWTTHAPSSTNDYLVGIAVDTYSYGQAVIEDLQTSYLPYFNGKSLAHINMVYGWDSSANTVRIAEEWDPTWTFGAEPSYGNPYGDHTAVPAGSAYQAVIHSANGQYVL